MAAAAAASSASIARTSSPFINKKEWSLSAFSPYPSLAITKNVKNRVPGKIMSVMSPPQSERKPATTGSVNIAMTATEKILARASEKTQLSPGENAWVNVDTLMTNDITGPGLIGTFKREFGQNAKVWNREKVVVIPDHYIFTTDEEQTVMLIP